VFLPDARGLEEFWGFTTALIRIGELLEASKLDSLAPEGYRYELSRIHPDTGQRDVFAGTGQMTDPVSFVVQVPNGQWTLSVAPDGGWHSSPQTLLFESAMALLIAVLVALLSYKVLRQPAVLSREVALRTRDLSESNRRLEAEIVERQHAEDALRESEGRFRNMADTVPVLIWMMDPAMQASYFNRAWLTFTGRTLEQELGEGWSAGLRGEEAEGVLQAVRRDFAEHRSFHGEFRLRRQDGEYRWLANHGIARFTPEGAFAGYIGASLDVTDLKNAERVLRTARDELEKRVAERTAELTAVNATLTQEIEERKRVEAALHEEQERQETLIKRLGEAQNQLLQSEKMASIGQLAAGVAHEINNPIGFINSNLNTLQGYIDDLLAVVAAYEAAADPLLAAGREPLAQLGAAKEKAELAYLRDDLPSLLKETQDGVVRVKKIVQDLKEFSHVDSLEWQVTDLHRGLDSTLNVVWNELKYKAEVVKDYGAISPVECLGSQLNQVFMNLLVNAAQAIDGKGVITIRTAPDGEGVRIAIADTGKGIPAENLNRIFEPFFTTKPVGKGTGLGLSLSYSIAKKHGGRIDVQSEVGKGSVFSVWLPLRRPALLGGEAAGAAEPTGA